ncbi:hypothetical protein BDF20DRAFT_876823 [Mycotypha africana]|uniref:uncharacterized protein n=1 Tax=Mycotypha africana TaxID=64632 RepID=UPI0023009541|nr:uncharacterized protein BDF20DRAFT_876823 [Mycotypha africana]KAI8975081.1 hypothetical protein BDF20DRAFT_876823 [Mycotypha africana]
MSSIAAKSIITQHATRTKKYFTELPSLKVLSRPPQNDQSEVTVYVKGFLAEGDSPDNFNDWMHSHRLLVLSSSHRWSPDCFRQSYSWPSGTSNHYIPIPIASLTSTAFFLAKNSKRLKTLRFFPTPASIAGALAIDAGLHAARLAYQFNTATQESQDRAEMLAWRLLQLRKKYDYLRIVGHSLGCRHIVEACSLMQPDERPDSVHLCAPALVLSDIADQIRKPNASNSNDRSGSHGNSISREDSDGSNGGGGLGRKQTLIYYSHKDITLGILLRILLKGEQVVGEIGLHDQQQQFSLLPEEVGSFKDKKDWLDPTVKAIDVSSSLGGFYIGAHTDYANKFHYFAQPF